MQSKPFSMAHVTWLSAAAAGSSFTGFLTHVAETCAECFPTQAFDTGSALCLEGSFLILSLANSYPSLNLAYTSGPQDASFIVSPNLN